ncbi:hypothetical protein ANCCAN_12124 [Ancylostoma caninum]|uniref:Uncharacterized protein n=1 Tax=Ancylostoma caninum TaxID=29170 RepID=A0A368GFV2_ANCCA|nr:hypothetical protein ANCCAN_12124 [Ancylostoma caninum]
MMSNDIRNDPAHRGILTPFSMEVASPHPRRQQSAASQPASQTTSTRSGEYQLTELKNVPTRSARIVSNDFERTEKDFPTIESSIDEELVLSGTASESQARDSVDEDFQVFLI